MSRGAEGHWHVENVDSGIDETSDDTESKMKAEKSLLQKGRKDQWRMKNLHNSEQPSLTNLFLVENFM